ncbi:hypothetical protein [Chachezhania sediminis]|uniref:hypothetical protein n=1 Tax=Chachezhania sediminis TaxID=2599291 RepID=UPI00131EC514|nr:hypothetical protein [Chachezhania sediminis]
MQAQADIAQELQALSQLAHEKLGTSGKTVAESFRRTRGLLPRRLRAKARVLAAAEPLASHPKLHLMLDTASLDRDAKEIRAHLASVDPKERHKGWWLGWAAALAFNILLVMVLLIVVLRWRGLI